ncbi:hypothetical protein [Chryseobacterium tongliaoense]|uniref:hypothetical protein n=1 Tax=Chryseobacterium tongliaoense TaxID=3240933 RepID=UPI0035185109
MRYLYFLLSFFFFSSCSVKSNEEKNCFTEAEEPSVKNDYIIQAIDKKNYTVKQILKEKPEYLEIINLKEYRSFKKDSASSDMYGTDLPPEKFKEKWKIKEKEFERFNEKFTGQFRYFSKQEAGNIQYALAENSLGYWLLKIENSKPSAYFLGLSFSHYYCNEVQENPIVKDGFLQIEGSLVKIIKMPGLPGYDDYSAIEDGKLFKINLKYLMKDSDRDGYNDIFEKSFGLNPDNKDSDWDGISDFDDMNPLFKSEKNKFTELYEQLLPDYGIEQLKKDHYSFDVYASDCDYFHRVNPELRILFVPESESKQTDYVRVTDVLNGGISKIKRNKNDPNRFYITEWGNSSSSDYSAEYINGKWVLNVVGGYIV